MSFPSPSAVFRRLLLVLCLLWAAVSLGLTPAARARDWYQARGPHQNGDFRAFCAAFG